MKYFFFIWLLIYCIIPAFAQVEGLEKDIIFNDTEDTVIVADYKDGVWHGECFIYNHKNDLIFQLSYKNGLKHGKGRRYHDMKLREIRIYNNDTLINHLFIENGRLFKEIEYYENGNIKEYITYYRNGRRMLETTYNKFGKEIEESYFRRNGIIRSRVMYEDGKHKESIYFNRKGVPNER